MIVTPRQDDGKAIREKIDMIAILIVTDDGRAYAMSDSVQSALECIKSVKKPTTVTYIEGTEKRLEWLGRAFDVIEEVKAV